MTKDHPELKKIMARLTSGMLSYLDAGDPYYEEEDIDRCRDILFEHVAQLRKCSNASDSMDIVQSTVIKLNELNERAGQDLIETDQREYICEYIMVAGSLLGCNDRDEDVTGEWREW